MLGPLRLELGQKYFGSSLYTPCRDANCYWLIFCDKSANLKHPLEFNFICRCITLTLPVLFSSHFKILQRWKFYGWNNRKLFSRWRMADGTLISLLLLLLHIYFKNVSFSRWRANVCWWRMEHRWQGRPYLMQLWSILNSGWQLGHICCGWVGFSRSKHCSEKLVIMLIWHIWYLVYLAF